MHTTGTISTDVLVIGGGATGIRAALSACGADVRVLLLSAGRPACHGATFAGLGMGWGFQALLGAERTARNLERFYNEIIQAGLGCADPLLARILVEESGPRLEDLLAYGLHLQTNAQNRFQRVPGCFSREPRAFLARDRRNIRKTFRAILRHSGAATLNASVLGLLVSEKICQGAWALASSGEILLIRAKAVILANGGGSGLFCAHAGPDGQTGAGYALALSAGAEMKNLEFIQFVIGFKQSRKLGLLPLDRLNEPGALTDLEGRDLIRAALPDKQERNRVIARRQSHAPFSSRDDSGLIDRRIAELHHKKEKVFFNDPAASGLMQVLHLAQAFNGGVKINAHAESSVPGLYAAGEIAAGPHGADRIGGCMLTATQVFGARAGRAAALYAKKIKAMPRLARPPELHSLLASKKCLTSRPVTKIFLSARKKFSQEVMVLRNELGLTGCLTHLTHTLKEINALQADPLSKIKSIQALMVMEAITRAALARKNSLGSHFRLDSN